jgi:hypothetical protein
MENSVQDIHRAVLARVEGREKDVRWTTNLVLVAEVEVN